MKKFFILMLSLFMASNLAFAGSFKADARTKRIPAGTIFKLQFLQPINTFSSCAGDSFVATIKNELTSDAGVIIPAGSVVRGSVAGIDTAKRFSRGGRLYIDFDHVVTPNGRQIPLDMAVFEYENIYYDGGLYKNLGYGEALKNNFAKSVEITKNATNYGLRAGESSPGIQYLTTPICAVGGFIGGLGYWVGDGIADMFRKGQDVYINQGDILSVKLIDPIDIPIY